MRGRPYSSVKEPSGQHQIISASTAFESNCSDSESDEEQSEEENQGGLISGASNEDATNNNEPSNYFNQIFNHSPVKVRDQVNDRSSRRFNEFHISEVRINEEEMGDSSDFDTYMQNDS